MTASSIDGDVKDLLRDVTEWRLIGLLLECPETGWQDQLAELAKEIDDGSLRRAVELARTEANEGLYHTVFGPGGPAPPREVSYRNTVHPGRFLAEIRDAYRAFAFTPRTAEAPDHVATQAGFIAYLRLKEAYARTRGDTEQATVCHSAAERFIEEHLSVMAQPLADLLTTSGFGYLAEVGAAIQHRVGPPRNAGPPDSPAPEVFEDNCSCG